MAGIHVLGSGFAALATVRELRRRGVREPITVVSPECELVYLPSLIWLPSGQRRGEDLRVPLGPWLERQRVHWHRGRVREVADGGRRTITDTGELSNDCLVIATGGRPLPGLPGMEEVLVPCAGIAQAEAVRDRLAALDDGTIAVGFAGNPREPSAVRGGPMFEFLFGIDRLLRRQGRRQNVRLVFFSPAQRPGQRLGEAVVDRLLQRMVELDIATVLGEKLLGFEADAVVTERRRIGSDLTLFMPGLTGPEWLIGSALPRSPGGFLACDEFCRVRGLERVYAAGDVGSYPGPEWMARQAHQAELQARAVAGNLVAELSGRPARHRFRSELACIVDSLDQGMLIYRSRRLALRLPRMKLLHWLKKRLERHHLQRYRR